MVQVLKNRKPLLHTFTRLCAIVGGVLSILGVVDSIWFRMQKLFSGGSKL
jgi:hypothetical protein